MEQKLIKGGIYSLFKESGYYIFIDKKEILKNLMQGKMFEYTFFKLETYANENEKILYSLEYTLMLTPKEDRINDIVKIIYESEDEIFNNINGFMGCIDDLTLNDIKSSYS